MGPPGEAGGARRRGRVSGVSRRVVCDRACVGGGRGIVHQRVSARLGLRLLFQRRPVRMGNHASRGRMGPAGLIRCDLGSCRERQA